MSVKKGSALAKVLLPLAVLGLAACAPPKVLFSNVYIGDDKIAQSVYQDSHIGGDAETFDFFVRICDLDETARSAVNCQETLIVDNVSR